MDADFWKEIGQQTGISAVILAIGGYMLKRWLTSSIAKDSAESGAIKVYERLNRQLHVELDERDAEWQARYDRLQAEYLDFRRRTQREFDVQRQVSRAMNRDIKKVNESGGRVPEERLETTMLITGMGPLDP